MKSSSGTKRNVRADTLIDNLLTSTERTTPTNIGTHGLTK